MTIIHHGAVNGVTGSCHELVYKPNASVLVDCGLFQGAETSGSGSTANKLAIDFSIDAVQALIVPYVHIDHVGRRPESRGPDLRQGDGVIRATGGF